MCQVHYLLNFARRALESEGMVQNLRFKVGVFHEIKGMEVGAKQTVEFCAV